MRVLGRLAQLVEHLVYTERVSGSSPLPPTSFDQTKPSGGWFCVETPERSDGVPIDGTAHIIDNMRVKGHREIAIAGCGIAGLAAALLLARCGHAVTLYEKFAAPRPMGSGLLIQPTGMAVLHALGLAEQVAMAGAPVAALLGRNSEGEAVLEAAYADLPQPGVFGLGIHRADLFGALFAATKAQGIALETSREVRGCDADGRLQFADGSNSRPHDLVVDALGVSSPLVASPPRWLDFGALWATVEWPGAPFDLALLEQRYERASRMAGLLPLGSGRAAFFWSLRGDEHAAWTERCIGKWHADICQLWPECAALLPQLAEPASLTFARYAHRTAPVPSQPHLVHIGDAWHSASPQLGQGANMALLDAFALAKSLQEDRPIPETLARFRSTRAGHVRLYQWLTWAFTPPFQSSAAWPAVLRDLLLAPASRIPPGPRVKALLVAGMAGSPLTRLGLRMPDYAMLGNASRA